jgi:hypothetical protein
MPTVFPIETGWGNCRLLFSWIEFLLGLRRGGMKRFSVNNTFIRRWRRAFFLSWTIPPLLIILALVWVLFSVPANACLRAEKMGALWLLASSLLIILPGALAGIYCWRSYHRTGQRAGLSIRLYPEGFGDIDYILVEKLFPNCQEVKLDPRIKGFSGAMVFLAESRDRDGSRQQPSVVKLGPFKKIQDEAENYDNYVNDFVGNAPELREPQYDKDDTRGGLRFSYARMAGEISTFEDFFLTRKNDACRIIGRIFSENVLGLCLLKQSPPGRRRLYYEDYRLGVRDWSRIINAVEASELLEVEGDDFAFGGQTYRNPLKQAKEWFGLEEDKKNRGSESFYTITAVVHGDLNARNILIDDNDNVFVIDFAKTGLGHILKDFCKLEVEIKFCLTKLITEADIKRAVDWEKRLLFAEGGKRHKDLRGLLTIAEGDLGFDKATTDCIRRLRQKASDMTGPLLDGLTDQYYLGLLHYTLDTLRYEQCDRNSKLYALISASLLCRALRRGDSRHRAHS